MHTRQENENECLRHFKEIYHRALKITKSIDRAEDLVQETYLKAFRYIDRLEEDENSNIRAWLFRIFHSICANKYRHYLHRSDYKECASVGSLYNLVFDSEYYAYLTSQEACLIRKTFDRDFRYAISKLPDVNRKIVEMIDIQGLSYKEVAKTIGRPIGTVMSRLHRGRSLLRPYLKEYASFFGIGEY